MCQRMAACVECVATVCCSACRQAELAGHCTALQDGSSAGPVTVQALPLAALLPTSDVGGVLLPTAAAHCQRCRGLAVLEK
jgi:hypothetical protein